MIAKRFGLAREKCRAWKRQGQKVVLTQGVFDLMHFAHIEYLSIASRQGSKLIVALDSDKLTRMRKGRDRPVNNWLERSMMLDSFEFVELVFPKLHLAPSMFYVTNLRPHVLVISDDTNFSDKDIRILAGLGISVAMVPRDRSISTTWLIDELRGANGALQGPQTHTPMCLLSADRERPTESLSATTNGSGLSLSPTSSDCQSRTVRLPGRSRRPFVWHL